MLRCQLWLRVLLLVHQFNPFPPWNDLATLEDLLETSVGTEYRCLTVWSCITFIDATAVATSLLPGMIQAVHYYLLESIHGFKISGAATLHESARFANSFIEVLMQVPLPSEMQSVATHKRDFLEVPLLQNSLPMRFDRSPHCYSSDASWRSALSQQPGAPFVMNIAWLSPFSDLSCFYICCCKWF